MTRLRICSYNIHKGFSQFNRRMVIHDLRDRLRGLNSDLVFLQEVQGLHLGHEATHDDWPAMPQHEFLAQGHWQQTAYGGNAVYRQGHHGNALISKLPILTADNQDVSLTRFERRGLLHCVVGMDNGVPLHTICVHVSLTDAQRRRQLSSLIERVHDEIPPDAPVIIAGDFNDWRNKANDWLARQLGMHEVFTQLTGRPARSFPSKLPVLTLDRIYVRHLKPLNAAVLRGHGWANVSDHAPLTAELAYTG
ncbi:endonuclease/exonuclease/phosphatase family protein [Niveibacterium sp. 24ML]|uniref:endonuclease/exonuclease/phosphatase family protein n=1 Tax=Niveibacterium sp. 24ML TaxID=2985512 RepID=UPI00226FC0BD|nr:endonuclease/exonuclease/phosphatase family protein [Niveibacterium sp. 24ML]MCX9154798.1 endonuclease/exonuclease/phosphatase family protein [Niveibacterium sp. 24ML]